MDTRRTQIEILTFPLLKKSGNFRLLNTYGSSSVDTASNYDHPVSQPETTEQS